MSVLNTASDGYPNVLVVLYRTLAAHGRATRERLLEQCSYPADGSARPGQTLLRWTQLGLFETEGDSLFIAPAWRPAKAGLEGIAAATAALPGIARRVLFDAANNDRFWDSEASRAADLTRGLSWLLAQDIYEVAPEAARLPKLETAQIADPDLQIVQNDVRLNGLLAWARFLGFLSIVDAPVIDPTEALRQDLPLLFGEARELTAEAFRNRVAALLPVLDRGDYRTRVEEVLVASAWRRPPDDMLSTALSRAVWRLRALRLLELDRRSDTGMSLALQRSGGREWERFTHVLPGGGLR